VNAILEKSDTDFAVAVTTMVRFKSQPQRALKQEPPKSGDNQPTILIVQNVTCLPYSSTHSQGPQSVLKATVEFLILSSLFSCSFFDFFEQQNIFQFTMRCMNKFSSFYACELAE
jgi:hypothetical protein